MTAPRRAIDADVPALLDLWAVGRTQFASTVDTAEAIRLVLARSPVFVIDGEDGLDGSIIAGWDGWRGNLYRLAVRPSARRAGLGTALVQAAERWLIAHGARRISLFVGFENDEARAFWRTVGYEPDEVIGRMLRDFTA